MTRSGRKIDLVAFALGSRGRRAKTHAVIALRQRRVGARSTALRWSVDAAQVVPCHAWMTPSRYSMSSGVLLPARETCAANGWRAGTTLASERWKSPRRIHAIDDRFVILRLASGHHRERLWLPRDVRAVEAVNPTHEACTRVSVYFPDGVLAALREKAARDGVSLSLCIRRFVEMGFASESREMG